MRFEQRHPPRRGILVRRITNPVALLVIAVVVALVVIRAVGC
jgi:hypothetical protein